MDVKTEMEMPLPSTVPALPPLTAAESERLQFDCNVRLWALRARFLAQKLLSLGRSYEVRCRLPTAAPASDPATPGLQLRDLGFDVMSLMDSHLLQVNAVTQPCFPQQLVNARPFAGAGVPRADAIRAIHVEDYLVGMDLQDFLVAPVPLPQLRKQVQRVQHQQQTSEKVLVLRFVRLDRLVQVDQTHTHGRVLETLTHIESQHADLSRSYAALLERNRTVVTRELTREKKLLSYVRILAVEMKNAVLEDEKFLFAFNFQQWYAAISDAQCDDDSADDDSEDDENERASGCEADDEPGTFDYDEIEIEISDDDDDDDDDAIGIDESGDDRRARRVPDDQNVVDLTMAADASKPPHHGRRLDLSRSGTRHPGTAAPRTYAKTMASHPLGVQQKKKQAATPAAAQRAPAVPRNPDMSWMDALAAADLKWLPHARALLASFIGGMMDSFEQDGSNHWRIPEITRSIAEQLVRLYIHKRHTLSLDNSALHKEFARHVRMLRSNLKNPKNGKLREDLLCGAVTTARLCEMSIDELAPEALRLERERRYEQHAQSSMIKAPTGPTLVKTKHGYKEVNFGGIIGSQESDPQPSEASSAVEDSRDGRNDAGDETMVSASFDYDELPISAGELPAIQRRGDTAASQSTAERVGSDANDADDEGFTENGDDEVTEKFQKAMDIQPRSPLIKKRVSFAEDSLVSFSQKKAELAAAEASKEEAERERALELRRAKQRVEDVRVGRDLLRTLFDPAHDIVESLRQFVETLKNAPLATMSREFVLATGVKLYRRSRPTEDYCYVARLQLGQLVAKSVDRHERNANIDAARKLIGATEHFKRSFGDLLEHLRQSFAFGGGSDSRQVRDRVLSYLVESKSVKFVMPPAHRFERNGVEAEEFEALVVLYDVPIALCRSSNLPVARNEASQEMLYKEDQSMDADRYPADRKSNFREPEEDRNAMYRKRHYEPSRDVRGDEPMLARRRIGEPGTQYVAQDDYKQQSSAQESSNFNSAVKVEASAPAFYVDNAGERKPHADRTSKALTEEQRIKSEVDGYQELVAQMFKNRDKVMAALDAIDWDARREIEAVIFDSKLSLTRIAKWIPESHVFACEIQAFGKRLVAKSTDSRLDVAGKKATSEFKYMVDTIYSKWKVLVRTYGDRKKHTPTTLMAGNETRSKNQSIVDLTEKRAGHLYECCITVNGHLAIRHACLNQKMAKRSASEEFRDALDQFLRLEEKQKAAATAIASSQKELFRNGSGGSVANNALAASASSASQHGASGTTSSNGNGKSQPRKHENLVLCSEDEDDDDYDSDRSSDSEYGAPAAVSVKPEKSQANLDAMSLKLLIEKEKNAPYDIASESTMADDARFRATIRSLFTTSDDLCEGIKKLRGSLKYRGSAENVIVPNVKATIQMERLREGTFEVRVAVNDVVHCVVSKSTKADACNAAIDGTIEKLHEIRSAWVQMLNFLHTKVLGSNDIMESFHMLRLANITSMSGSVEKPALARDYNHHTRAPPAAGVHYALGVGDYTTYRVVGDTEEEARLLADCRTAKYIANLIDAGLIPEEDEDESGDSTKLNMEVDQGSLARGEQARASMRPDWTCTIKISDFIEDTVFHTFRVDALWRQKYDLPAAADFPLEDIVVTQVGKIAIEKLETMLTTTHESVFTYFSLESPFEQWKFVRQVAAYGHKARAKAFALELEISPAGKYVMYLIPPGASINSEDNLYWPARRLPRELDDRKQIYGFLKLRHYQAY